jgi:8-oxo-dGTP diphosphatase
MRKRQASRVLIFNPQGEILLMRFAIPQSDGSAFVFWAAPGGEIEPGETETEAAHREIREELGLSLAIEGPIWIDHNSFFYRNELQDNTDFYFRAECLREAPKLIGLTPEELEIMKEIRWWTAEELDRTDHAAEKIFPIDLASRVHRLLAK